jgi:hypothetical protein
MRPRMLCPSSLVAALLCSAALLQRAPAVEEIESCPEGQAEIDPRLAGLWQRFDAVNEGDPLRFYFFHPDGFGLYRYGKVGLNNTHSFDYGGSQGVLDLRFRKTDRAHAVGYRFESQGGREWLVLAGDPREHAAEVRYFKLPDRVGRCRDGVLTAEALRAGHGELSASELRAGHGELSASELRAGHGEPATGVLGGRMWGDEQRYATGGMGFSIYQLQGQAIDGRGVGWHHRGDYDEWTTESLNYRQQGGRLTLQFPLRHEAQSTTIGVREGADKVRVLDVHEDPRDFWRAHSYRDMGPSFADCAESLR